MTPWVGNDSNTSQALGKAVAHAVERCCRYDRHRRHWTCEIMVEQTAKRQGKRRRSTVPHADRRRKSSLETRAQPLPGRWPGDQVGIPLHSPVMITADLCRRSGYTATPAPL